MVCEKHFIVVIVLFTPSSAMKYKLKLLSIADDFIHVHSKRAFFNYNQNGNNTGTKNTVTTMTINVNGTPIFKESLNL